MQANAYFGIHSKIAFLFRILTSFTYPTNNVAASSLSILPKQFKNHSKEKKNAVLPHKNILISDFCM